MQESEDEHAPDSTQDENNCNEDWNGDLGGDDGSDISTLSEIDDEGEPLLGHNNSVRQDSSLTSLDSQQSANSQSLFKKIPILNRTFIKPNRTSTVCKPCGELLHTVEITRLMAHVKKCSEMDAADKLEYVEEYNKQATKRMRKASTIDSRISELWAKFMVENNVALRCVESQSFKDFVLEAAPLWKSASRKTYSNYYIPAISNSIKDSLKAMVKHHGDDFVTLEFDHWSDINGRSFLGIVFTFLKGHRYLHSLEDVSMIGHSSDKTIPYIKKALRSVSPNAINSIMSDSASACRLTRELTVKDSDFKRIIEHRCMAHLFNRMGTLFNESEPMKKALKWAAKVTNLISSNTRLSAMLRAHKCRKPKSACSTRWYSTINMVESLIESKSTILECLPELTNASKLERKVKNEAHWTTLSRAGKIMRPLVDCIAISERANGTLGEAVSALLCYARDIMRSDWNDPLILEALSAFLVYFGPSKLGIDEFGLMLTAYALDRRNNCNFLTEEGLKQVLKTLTGILNKTGLASPNVNDLLLQEFTAYSLLSEQFSKDQPQDQLAIEWWANINSSSTFKLLAIRIARLRSSSANIERTFSALRWIQGSRRANLSIDTLTHMTRIKIYENNDQYQLLDDVEESRLTNIDNQLVQTDSQDQPTLNEHDGNQNRADDASKQNGNQDIASNSPRVELLSYEMRSLYDSFCEFVDFTINNKPIEAQTIAPAELSDEQRDELLQKFREMRRKIREKSKS